MDKCETVVLIHGLGGSRLDMWPIARRLKRAGYRVRNWGYRSIGGNIESHAEKFGNELASLDAASNSSRFHLVTFSMGSIIARVAFEKRKFDNLGRVVMLAPPNKGSHVARKLTPYIGWLTPSLEQLSDEPASFVNQLSNSLKRNNIEFGIVEAKKDRVIAKGGVQLEGQRDFAAVEGHHGLMPWYTQTIDFVERFLADGCFSVSTLPEKHRSHNEIDAATVASSLEMEASS